MQLTKEETNAKQYFSDRKAMADVMKYDDKHNNPHITGREARLMLDTHTHNYVVGVFRVTTGVLCGFIPKGATL